MSRVVDLNSSPSKPAPATETITRSLVFDLLRALALILIILAHSKPPALIANFRNFEVPLIVVISGAAFALSGQKSALSYGAYVWKRMTRLLLPTFLFLAVYVTVVEFILPPGFGGRTILRSFLLLDGIGYVWIIRVFLLIALLAPPLWWLRSRLSSRNFYLVIFAVYLFHEYAWHAFDWSGNGPLNQAFTSTFFYALPYGCFFAVGLAWPSLSRTNAILIGLVSLGVWLGLEVALSLRGEPVLIWEYKYPARLVYVWYALGMVHVLFAAALSLKSVPTGFAVLVQFISRSSLWVYLWHIPFLRAAGKLFRFIQPEWSFLPIFGLTLGLSVAAVWAQRAVVAQILNRLPNDGRLREWTKIALLP